MQIILNQKQQQAITRLKDVMTIHQGQTKYPLNLTRFEVTKSEYGDVMISAEMQHGDTVPENSLLRIVDRQFWVVFVGKRGALTAKIGPKSLQQFQGKKFLGINIDYI